MAAACAELRRRGHPVQRVSKLSAKRSRTGYGWAVGIASRGAGVPSLIIVADPATDEPVTRSRDRRAFQRKERVTSSDVSHPHVAAQLIQPIGWALLDAENAEIDGTRRASCP